MDTDLETLPLRKPFADVLRESSLGDLYAMRRESTGLSSERLRRIDVEIAMREASFSRNQLDRDLVRSTAAKEAHVAVRKAILPVIWLIMLVGFLAGACAAMIVLVIFSLI